MTFSLGSQPAPPARDPPAEPTISPDDAGPGAAGERLLVCISPSPLSALVVQATWRMASRLRVPWVAAYVETPQHARLSQKERGRLTQNLRQAELLGAEVVTLSGDAVASTVLAYASRCGVTRIVLGKPTHPRWYDVLFGSVVEDIIRGSGDIDINVITGEPGAPTRPPLLLIPSQAPPLAYGKSALVLAVATVLAFFVDQFFGLTEVIMVYLLGIVLVALRYGRGPALLTSTLSVAAFNFLFVPPRYTFAVAEGRYLVTFTGMFVIGLVISNLTARVRWQADMALARERHSSALYSLTRALSRERDTAALARRAALHVADFFGCQAMVLLPRRSGRSVASLGAQREAPDLEQVSGTADCFTLDERERSLAEWVFSHNDIAGLGTGTQPQHPSLHVPLASADRCIGVLALRPVSRQQLMEPAQRNLLIAFCDQIGMALLRALWADEAQRTARRAEREELRNTLLSSVSHDLRTPLAAIAGTASTLLQQEGRAETRMSEALRRELLEAICEGAEHMNRLVINLLDMTRLEFGDIQLHKEWIPLSEVIGSALNRLEQRLGQHVVAVNLPAELPLIPLDPVLAEQLLHNLIENAIKYTPPGTLIEISAAAAPNMVTVAVADRGPGIPPDAEERVFEKFFRGPYRHGKGGVGLGLTICRGIVEAHGGQISATSRSGGGAVFCFTMPIEGEPPPMPPDGVLAESAPDELAPQGAPAP